ncbi:hypothetical protein [Oceanobacillus sp. CAU 1775]
MEKQIEIMKQASALLETVEEGLVHAKQLLNEGKYEQATILFSDIVLGFSTIESSLTRLAEEVITVQIEEQSNKVRKALDLVVTEFEDEKYGPVQEIMQFNLIPQFKKWKGLLDEIFGGYILN